MIFFKKKKEKRAVKLSGWIPNSESVVDSNPRTQSGNLSQLKRALTMYRDVLMSCPLVARDKEGKEVSHYLLDLLEKPCPWLNKAEFFTKLTEDFFLAGNFYAFIKSNASGKIEALLPFNTGTIFAYSKTNLKGNMSADSSDPIALYKQGFYYQTQYATGEKVDGKPQYRVSKVGAEDVLHLKNVWQSDGDQLNGLPLFKQYPEVLGFSESVLDLGFRFASSGGVGPVLISGVESQSAEETQETKEVIERFFENKGMYLTLQTGTEITEIGKSATSHMIQALSSISSLHLARIMGCPVQLIEREDALNASGGGQNLKETYRFFLRTSAKSFLKNVESKLNELVDDPGVRLEFNFRSLMASDLRESAMSLAQLIQSEAVTKDEVRDWLRI